MTLAARLHASRLGLALLIAALSLASFGPTLWTYYRPSYALSDICGFPYGRDFLNTWAGPRIAFAGHVRELFDLSAYYRLLQAEYGRWVPVYNWSYPPSLLAWLWPLSRAPYLVAYAIWVAVLTPTFVLVGVAGVQPGRRAAAITLLLLAPACLINMINGQNGFLTGALLLGGLALLPRRPMLAGVLFGLLTIKPHLGFALAAALLALGAWRTILAASATAAAMVGQSVLMFGWEPWKLYLTVTSGVQLQLLKTWQGFYTTAMASVLATARSDGLPYSAASALQGAVTLAVLGAVVWAMRRTDDWKLRTAVVVLATPLATPYAFNYDLPALSAVIAWRLLDDEPLSTVRRAVYVLAWLAPGLMMRLAMSGPGLMAYPLLLAFIVCLTEVAERSGVRALRTAPTPAVALGAPA